VRFATLADESGSTKVVVIDGAEMAAVDAYADMGALLAAGERGLADARLALASGERKPLDEGRVLRPVLNPGAVFCVGLNFRSHILEMGRELPVHPTLFAKLGRSLTDPGADVGLPPASTQVDYEGELVVAIGRRGRNVPEGSAHEYIAGYTIMNDVSMRDWQYRTLQWFAGKNFERSTPVGPWLVTPDEFDLGRAGLTVTVNGEQRQSIPLSELVFDPGRLIADVSRITTLEPGDLIATGTPGGVGHAMEPASYLRDGDVVEVTIDGIGTLRNRFKAA
jgi:acylpyruvate hydrolase